MKFQRMKKKQRREPILGNLFAGVGGRDGWSEVRIYRSVASYQLPVKNRQKKKQIPFGNDKQKSNGKDRRRLSTE
jgi:hypothetical protein